MAFLIIMSVLVALCLCSSIKDVVIGVREKDGERFWYGFAISGLFISCEIGLIYNIIALAIET